MYSTRLQSDYFRATCNLVIIVSDKIQICKLFYEYNSI